MFFIQCNITKQLFSVNQKHKAPIVWSNFKTNDSYESILFYESKTNGAFSEPVHLVNKNTTRLVFLLNY